MAEAARTAATLDGKEIRNPSPKDLCTRPPKAATWCCTTAACEARMSSAARSSRACSSSVELTTSIIMIVSTLAEVLRSDKDCLRVSAEQRTCPLHYVVSLGANKP